jgi:SH3-like domain-containing protein
MRTCLALLLAVVALIAAPARAQERDVPYWASIRASELNMRVGPSRDYKVSWVYRRPGLPVKVVRVMEGWRLIQDPDGEQGWVVARLLSPDRTAMVIGDEPIEMRDAPDENGSLRWRAAPGVVGTIDDCSKGWCAFEVEGREGWVRQDRLFGAQEP